MPPCTELPTSSHGFVVFSSLSVSLSCWCFNVQDQTWPCHSIQQMPPRPPSAVRPARICLFFYMPWVIRAPNRSCMVMAFSVVSVIMPLHPFNITGVDSRASVILQKSIPLSTDTHKQSYEIRREARNYMEDALWMYGMTYCHFNWLLSLNLIWGWCWSAHVP